MNEPLWNYEKASTLPSGFVDFTNMQGPGQVTDKRVDIIKIKSRRQPGNCG